VIAETPVTRVDQLWQTEDSHWLKSQVDAPGASGLTPSWTKVVKHAYGRGTTFQ
jgi:hypothetical protein